MSPSRIEPGNCQGFSAFWRFFVLLALLVYRARPPPLAPCASRERGIQSRWDCVSAAHPSTNRDKPTVWSARLTPAGNSWRLEVKAAWGAKHNNNKYLHTRTYMSTTHLLYTPANTHANTPVNTPGNTHGNTHAITFDKIQEGKADDTKKTTVTATRPHQAATARAGCRSGELCPPSVRITLQGVHGTTSAANTRKLMLLRAMYVT